MNRMSRREVGIFFPYLILLILVHPGILSLLSFFSVLSVTSVVHS